MKENEPLRPPVQPLTDAADPSLHRSGAVARMLRMPVATLRVWERRYGLTQPALSPSGQRLYSADEVRRLTLLKQLTDVGHAIGSLASLDMVQLQRVAATHAHAQAHTQKGQLPDAAHLTPVRPWRLAVIGAALGIRLQRPALLRRIGRPLLLLGPFDDIAQAAAELQGLDVDTLLIHEPHLHAGWLDAVHTVMPALAGVPTAVFYGFAADPVCDALATAGTALLREPQPDAVVAQWLHNLSLMASTAPQPATDPFVLSADAVPPRRWDDAALADFTSLASAVACECPRHVAELLVQLSHFETYSAECAHRSAADAELHTYLGRVAAASRVRFEAALEHVALHEGLMLPLSPQRGDAALTPKTRRPQAVTAAKTRR